MQFILFVIITIIWSVPVISIAQSNDDTRFIRYTTSDGLSNPWVSDIFQSQDGFIWIATQYGINRFDGLSFESHVYNPNNMLSLNNNWVLSITESIDGHIWLGTYGKSLHEYDPLKESFKRHHGIPDDICYLEWIDEISIDGKDRLWVATRRGELVEYQISEPKNCLSKISLGHRINDLICTDEFVLCGTTNGLYIIDKQHTKIISILSENRAVEAITKSDQTIYYSDHNEIYHFMLNKDGSFSNPKVLFRLPSSVQALAIKEEILLAGGEFGLMKYNLQNGSKLLFQHDESNPFSLIDGKVMSIMIDKERNIWVGGIEGLSMLPAHQNHYYSRIVHPSIRGHERAFTFGFDEQDVYIGNDFGLTKYSGDRLEPPTQLISNLSIRSLIKDPDGNFIFGSDFSPSNDTRIGIYKWDFKTDKVSQYHQTEEGILSTGGRAYCLITDDYEGVFAGSLGRLFYLYPGRDTFSDISHLFNIDFDEVGIILHMALDREDYLWIATTQDGLYKVKWTNPKNTLEAYDIQKYFYDPSDKNSISSNLIQYLYESKSGDMWVATDGGLNLYDDENDHFIRYTRENGLVDDKILGIAEDSTGQLWMSTISHGLLSFYPDNPNFVYHRQKDGIYHDAFLLHSVAARSDGLLFWGNEGGVQVFNPFELNNHKYNVENIYLTDIFVNNQKLQPGKSDIIESAPEFLTQLYLSYNQNDLTFSFGLPDYQHANQYQFKYQLQGASDNWVHLDQIQRISFAHLSPGTYNLTVEGCLFSNCIRSPSLQIIIAQPWWLSGWAWIIYILMILAFTIVAIYLISTRQRAKLELFNREEISKTQAQFFTNMAHEIRTPLTLIIGPAKRLLNKKRTPTTESNLVLNNISKQADHILSLVNNLLDLSKIDAGIAPLKLKKTALSPFLISLVDSFRFQLNQKNIELELIDETSGYRASIDREKLRIIVSNILSNATKYSGEGDKINVHLFCANQSLSLVIKDTGIGMSAVDVDQIYKRFYRAKTAEGVGSGIGMALVKEVIDLIGGTIAVTSEINKGTSVFISLPLNELILESVDEEIYANDMDLLQILLVEDNSEIARFVKAGLVKTYNVSVVENGSEGFQRAIKQIPDLIITDIMMPKTDGFQLCIQLKNHPLTDHIPVIMLSARSDEQSRIQAMQSGADGYITKPYSDDELLLQVENILTTQHNLLKKKNVSAQNHIGTDSPFMKEFKAKTEDLIKKGDLSIEGLCKSLFISRSQLHRKIKSVTGQSTTELLNEIKMSIALNLLSSKELTIAEICYESGYTNPSYFTEVFQKKFSYSPSAYRNKLLGQKS